MELKWGFAAAGRIANDYIKAVGTLDKNDHQIVAVADPIISLAEETAKRFDIPKAYGSFLELAQDPNVEVVHVGSLNPHHFEIALLMLQHGKHVLVQKPMCMNEKQVRKLIAVAKEKNLFLTEGMWSRMLPSYQYIRKQIQDGKLGEILSVDFEFGNNEMGGMERVTKKSLGGGSVLDMGVYTIQFCHWVFQQEPKSIKASGKLNNEGIDVEFVAEFDYGSNKVGRVKTSILQKLSNEGIIVGTKGKITIPTCFAPTSLIDVDGSEKSWPLPKEQHEFTYINSCGLRYEADQVRKCIRAGQKENEFVKHEDSLIFARVEDEIRKQLGVKYPADEE